MTMFRIAPAFGAAAILAGFVAGPATVAVAQSDPQTQQIIERLTPVTRGIRVPGASPGAASPDTPTPQPPVQPAPVYAPPTQSQVPPPPGMAGPGVPPVAAPPAVAPRVPAAPAVAAAPRVPPPPGAKPGERTAPPVADTTAGGAAAISLAVFFPTGSATLTPAAERELAPLGRALNAPQLASFRFRIEGHTDSVGDAASNQMLSERRAAAVREYLVRRWGVSPERLQAIGLGESQLLVPTPDETPNPRNRRVQVVNLDS